ncbi:MAG TPA: hypothetical protein HPP77_04325 [Candidatus Hydrogenedentes bacterium]|nr:hypothetical protein [Candidatus Hydrogenedentota bacterium]HIJ73285.1 hypothetical protein [Candidatus Hydrogenedentota bacterium]
MTRSRCVTLTVLAVTVAFLGGMVSAKLPGRVHAATDRAVEKLDVLEVRVLKVVDKAGRTRAWLGIEEGDPLFVMESKSGEPRMALGAHDAGASLSLIGQKGKTGIAIFESTKVSPTEHDIVWRAP